MTQQMEYGFQVAEAILEHCRIFSGANKEDALNAYAFLAEQYKLTHDYWIGRAIGFLEREFDINAEEAGV